MTRYLLRPPTRVALIGILAVVLASLLAARLGYDPLTPRKATRSTNLERTLSCVPDIPGATARVGTLDSSAGSGQGGVTSTPDQRIHFTPASADAGYGVRWAATPNNLAVAPCPAPRAEWWFLGAGAGVTHHSVLTLDNPRTADAIVDVDVSGQAGPVNAPRLHGVLIPAGGSTKLDLADSAPAIGDLGVHVTASRGLVAASMQERWAADAASKPALAWVADQPAASTQHTLLGIPDGTNHATLMVANPGRDIAVVNVKASANSGTFTPAGKSSFTVPPGSVAEVSLDDALSTGPRAFLVSSQIPVSAGVRALKGITETYASGGEPFAPFSVVALPEGANGQLTLVGGPRGGTLKVEQYDANGAPTGSETATVPPNASVVTALAPTTKIVRVSGNAADVRGVVIADAGAAGASTLPLRPTASEAQVPIVEPGWR